MKTLHKNKFSLSIILPLLILLSFCPAVKGEPKNSEPGPIHERIEWTDIWVTNAEKSDLPRVLFVGDSIVRGYFYQTEKKLSGKANCARYTTSAFLSHEDFLAGLKILLTRYQFDVIQINNGLHGWDYSEEQYKAGFPKLVSLLRNHAKEAKIIWAMTTPVRQKGNLTNLEEAKTKRVRKRNIIAAEIIKENGFKTSDLFSLSIEHPEHHSNDGVHFSNKGKEAQADYISKIVSDCLKSSK